MKIAKRFRSRKQPRRTARRLGRRTAARKKIALGRAVGGARSRLQGYRQASILAIAMTGLLLFVFAPGEATAPNPLADAGEVPSPAQPSPSERPAELDDLVPQAAGEIRQAIDTLISGFLLNLPKFLVAIVILVIAGWLATLLRRLIRRFSRRWERGDAIGVLVMAGFWVFALGIAISIIAGDLRALLGSLGLVGLALSWALQTPIESFTGWLLNSLRGYYRVGDRIAVGEIFGDVDKIDVLTTTVWEIGGPDRPGGQVNAEQPTGRLITFPNNEILTGTVVNLTKDFPYVWNELEVVLAAESDIDYALSVLGGIADDLLKSDMQEPARQYAAILNARNLDASVADRPQLFVSLADAGAAITIRYLVDARRRRPNQSELTRRILSELRKPAHADRIIPYYPRRQVQALDAQGRPRSDGDLAFFPETP